MFSRDCRLDAERFCKSRQLILSAKGFGGEFDVRMKRLSFNTVTGLALVGLALLLPAGVLIAVLRGSDAAADPALSQGIWVFRAVLILTGGYLLLLRVLPVGYPQTPQQPELAPASQTQTVVFGLVLLVATGLRLYHLGTGIWYDEILTSVNYMPLTVGQIVSTYHDANNHVLFSVLARLSLSVFGDSVWALRFPAAVFGVAGIGAMCFFARRVGPTQQGLFAAALMTFSYHHIWFSQNARGYTALLFFSVLSSAWFLDAMRQGSPRKWGLYCLAVVLGAYAHPTMGLMVLAHFAIWAAALFQQDAARRPYRWNGLFCGFIPVGLLTLLAYALVLPSMVGGALLNSGLQGSENEWTNPLWALAEVFSSLQIGFASAGVVFAAGLVFAAGVVSFARTRPAVVALFLIPVGVGFIAMTSIGYTLFPRFFFFTFGFAILVVIRGAFVTGQLAARLIRLPAPAAGWLPAVLCAGIVAVSILSLRHVYLPKQDYAGAIALIEREKQAGDTVLAVGIAGFPFNDYYHMGWDIIETGDDLDRLAARSGRTWLVYTMPVHARTTYPDILARIEQEYSPAGRFFGSLGGGEVVVSLENRGGGPRADDNGSDYLKDSD